MNDTTKSTTDITCGSCLFMTHVIVKAGAAAIGQERIVTECRRFPPTPVAILGLPLDALAPKQAGTLLGVNPAMGAKTGQIAPLPIIGAHAVYPPIPENFPICAEYSPNNAGSMEPGADG